MKTRYGERAISAWRIHLLRLPYLIVVIGVGSSVWPSLMSHAHKWPLMDGVVQCMLAAFALLCALGLLYPLKMLPVLFWELLWKGVWLATVAYPQWKVGRLDGDTERMALMCLMAVIFPLAMPWDYIWRTYVRRDSSSAPCEPQALPAAEQSPDNQRLR